MSMILFSYWPQLLISLSKKKTSPSIQIKAIAKIIQKIGCTKIGVIRAIDSYGTDLYNGLVQECQKVGINIHVTLELEPTENQITLNEIVKLKNLPLIIVVVSYPLTKVVIEYAQKYGMTGPNYIWFFSEGAVSQIPLFLKDVQIVTHWFATVPPSGPIPDYINQSLISPSVNMFSVYVYDSILLLATAINKLIQKENFTQYTNYSALRKEIISLDLIGLSGRMRFDITTGERRTQYYIIKNGPTAGEYTQIATYDSDTTDINLNESLNIGCLLPPEIYFPTYTLTSCTGILLGLIIIIFVLFKCSLFWYGCIKGKKVEKFKKYKK